jgi:UDP-N-acetylmuramate--alanine ligase
VLGHTRRVHCIGVGGAGVSAIAEVLVRTGFEVSGCDEKPSPVTERLAAMGVSVFAGHGPEHVSGTDVVVVSSAVRSANPELVEARRRGIPVVARGEMLAELMRPRFGIAVAGAHGKTTTTAMIALMLEQAGLDPTALIGGYFGAFGGNARVGGSEYLVAEADESDRSFLRLSPTIAVITNLDREHLQSYAGFEELTESFVQFANRLPFYGSAVICADDPPLSAARSRMSVRVVTYGLDPTSADVVGRNLRVEPTSSTATVLARRTSAGHVELGELRVGVPGRHNVLNALAAVTVGLELSVPFDAIVAGLAAFRGTARRFESRGEVRGIRVVDDYGHHPTELATVLDTARRATHGRVIVAFQPHRYSRTQHLRDEFAATLARADEVLLADIYAAGEDPIAGVTVDWLAEAVEREAPGRVRIVRHLRDLPAVVAGVARAGDLVITLGAGSIGESAGPILDEIRRCG